MASQEGIQVKVEAPNALAAHEVDAAMEILQEYRTASAAHGEFNSAHEGYAVILEELDELWEEVREKKQSIERMRREAVQIGAMAMRFIVDVAS